MALFEYLHKNEGHGPQLLDPCGPISQEAGTEYTEEAKKEVTSLWEVHHPLALLKPYAYANGVNSI